MFRKFAFIAALAASGSVWAQTTVEEAIKAGAVKMTKEELQALHAGGRFTLSGTWLIDDSGRYCHDVKASGGLAFNSCSIIWKAGNKYFAAQNETPSTRVSERQFVK